MFRGTTEWGSTLSAVRKVLAKSVDFVSLPALDLLKNGCERTRFYA
jgi:hypothetical protein